jgi:hypothetical protein
MLWGLGSLALPILAHMVHRHTSKRLAFPSLRYIRITEIPRKGKNIPTDLLLLLLRLLLLAGLVLFLAGPKFVDPDQPVVDSGSQTIFLIDNSASMTGWNAQEGVKQALGNVLENTPGPVGFVTFTDKFGVSEETRKALETYDPASSSLTRGDPQQAINTAISLFSPEAQKRRLVILSDFQSSQWQLVTAQLGSLGVEAEFHPVAPERDGNLTIQNVRTSPAGNDQIRIWAQITNHSSEKLDIPVSLHTGEETTEQRLTLGADQSGQVQFLVPRDEYLRGSITIGKDSYAADNTWHFWLMAPPASKIEFLMTPDKDPVGQEESFFLRTAILSSTQNEWQSYNITHHTLKVDKPDPEIETVVIPGLDSHVSPEVLEAARLHVQNGGKLIITPGHSPAEMITRLREQDLLSADYRGTKESTAKGVEPFRIQGVHQDTPLANIFQNQAAKDLYLAQIHKYVSVKPRSEESTVLLDMEDGSPLLIQTPIGAGNLFLFTTRFHSTWSDLPLRNCFLPIIRELLSGYGEQITRQWPNLSIGQIMTKEEEGIEPFEAKEAGLFRWEDQLISVNTAREESTPAVLSLETVRQNLGASDKIQKRIVPTSNQQNIEQNAPNPYLQGILLFALGLLLIESLWVRPKQA